MLPTAVTLLFRRQVTGDVSFFLYYVLVRLYCTVHVERKTEDFTVINDLPNKNVWNCVCIV